MTTPQGTSNAYGPGAIAAGNIQQLSQTFNYKPQATSFKDAVLGKVRKPKILQALVNEFHPGTRVWIFQAVRDWMNAEKVENRVFLVVGHAGVGKSTLAAKLIDQSGAKCHRTESEPSAKRGLVSILKQICACSKASTNIDQYEPQVFAYHFFDHRTESDSSAKQCVLSICKQLCAKLKNFECMLDSAILPEELKGWTSEICFEKLLVDPLAEYTKQYGSPGRIMVVVDALDECEEGVMFKRKVVDQWNKLPNWMFLFATCRPDVQDFPKTEQEAARNGITMLKTGDPSNIHESECVKQNMNDIKIVLYEWLKGRFTTKKLLDEAVETIANKSGGLFLYLRFFKEQLHELKEDQILNVDDLPKGIENYYERYFSRLLKVLGNDGLVYKLTLGSVLASREPLPLALWMRAIGVQGELDDDKNRDEEYKLFRKVRTICRSLMYIPDDLAHASHLGIMFIHKSMSDFLTGGCDEKGSALNINVDSQLHIPINHNQMLQLLEELSVEEEVVMRFVQRNLFYHRCIAKLFEEATEMLFNLDTLLHWLQYASPLEIIHDVTSLLIEPDAEVNAIVKLLRLGQHALTADSLPAALPGKQLPSQLPSQILGRLDKAAIADRPRLRALRDAANWYDPGVPWLKPVKASLASALPGGLVQTLKGHSSFVFSVAYNHDGTRIVSSSNDNTIRIWDASTGEPIGKPLTGHSYSVTSVAYNHDGTRIVSGSGDSTIRIWDAITGEPIGKPLTGHSVGVNSVAYNHDGTRIVSGSGDSTIRIWDASTGESICKPLRGHSAGVNSVAYNYDGTRIVSGSGDRTIRIWDASTGEPIGKPLTGYSYSVNSVAYNHDGTRIVSGSLDGTIRIWDASTGESICKPLRGHSAGVNSVAYNYDGTRIVSGSGDRTIRIWDASTGEPIGKPLTGYSYSVNSVAYNHDGTRIVSGAGDSTIRIWDASTGEPIGKPLTGYSYSVNSVAYNHDGTRIVSGSGDSTIRIWDASTGEPIGKPLTGHSHRVISVAYNHDGTRIVSGSGDRTIRIWDASTGEPIGKPLTGHSDEVMSVAYNQDGTRIVSGSLDGTIRIWDASTGESICKPLTGHSDEVNSVAYNHDGTRIVSGSYDNTIRIWDASTGEPIGKPLTGHSDEVISVAYNQDGTRIVSGSTDNTLRIWDASTGEPIVDQIGFTLDNAASIHSESQIACVPEGNCIHILHLIKLH